MRQAQVMLEQRPAPADAPTREWIVAALLFGLVVLVGIREGGFWPRDALVAAVGSVALLVVAAAANPLDRRALSVVAALVVLALWWGLRAASSESVGAVLPFGASCIACASAYAAVRPLRGSTREMAGLGVACLGAAGSLVGFAGLIWRWYPLAMPAQGLWRLSTTLTYSDAAGLVLGMCLLVALGVDRYPGLARVAVCLSVGGLLATQSRGAYVAVACACTLVPWRRYVRFCIPLLAGVTLGAMAIATSPDRGAVPWLGVVLVVTIGISAVPERRLRAAVLSPRMRRAAPAILLLALLGSLFVLQHEIALRAFAPSDQDRSMEWSAAWQQWGSAPIFGVGPDHLLLFHTADGAYARFVHNEYLQVAADAGAVGLALLLAAMIAIMRVVRRSDALSSCACAALVCCAVGGAFDFDWHLVVVGFLAGWCVGLAATAEPIAAGGVRNRIRSEAR